MFFSRRTELDPGFEEFVLDRSAALLRTAYLLTGDSGHAEDLVQVALLRTALKWRNARENPEAYARRVLVNLARDRWRRSRRRVAEQSVDALPSAPALHRDHANAVVDRELLQRALAALPHRQREGGGAALLRGSVGRDTAVAMGTSEGTVKSYTSRALTQLRQSLGGHVTTNLTEVNHV